MHESGEQGGGADLWPRNDSERIGHVSLIGKIFHLTESRDKLIS
jgi:hypothetical protein